MQVVLIASAEQKQNWLSPSSTPEFDFVCISQIEELSLYAEANVIVDLLFQNTASRRQILDAQQHALVLINSVSDTLQETNKSWVRIAGWPGFLNTVIEAASMDVANRKLAEETFGLFGKKIAWVPDEPGFVTPRVIGMIINEAWLAVAEGVSTREEIDTAMKLGTAYPFGPFEWTDKIGAQNLVTLLQKLSVAQPRYTPATLLLQETDKGI